MLIVPDARHSETEERLWGIGKTASGRFVFLVFTIRARGGKRLIRPVSARYMHRKEVSNYEEDNPDV
ncbi:MAG: BrnT family toxin [Nitrospirota bacterium]